MATKDRLLALEQQCLKVERKLRLALCRLEGWEEEKMHLYLSPEDKVRLLNLFVWSRRYGVTMEYLLEILLHRHFAKHRRKERYLGVRVSALMSKPAEAYVEETLREEFPNNEMKRELQEKEKRRVARILDSLSKLQMTTTAPDDYEQQWQHSVRREQRHSRLFPRSWRGNPWR